MGGCFSKKKTTSSSSSGNTVVTPSEPPLDLPPQNLTKKEVFVIKHRISHEIDTNSDHRNNRPTTASSCSNTEELKLTRSKSTGAQNPNRRRYSRSKRSYDFDLITRIENANQDYDGDTISTRSSGRRAERRSAIKERRISISPTRRSQSPSLHNLNTTPPSSSSKPPAKMVSVPATHKTKIAAPSAAAGGSGGVVKRIHVKRHVSPARNTSLRVYTEISGQERTQVANPNPNQRRKSLVEINGNAARSNAKTTPKTYASLLLDDIHKFHQTNANRPAASSSPAFEVPECVNKAYSIMEAVAEFNSYTRLRNPTSNKDSFNGLSTDIQVQECRKPNSTDSTAQVTKFSAALA